MNLEERKNNTYFDKSGKQILVGDLLEVFHFKAGKINHYMYQVVVMENTNPFPVMAIKSYYADKPHCRMYVVANNPQRVFFDAKIIAVKYSQTKRLRIKIKPND